MDGWIDGWDRWMNEGCAVQMCDGKMSGRVAASVGGMAGATGVCSEGRWVDGWVGECVDGWHDQ